MSSKLFNGLIILSMIFRGLVGDTGTATRIGSASHVPMLIWGNIGSSISAMRIARLRQSLT